MTKLEIPVAGMHCEGCARTLQIALQRLDGVRAARSDFQAALVRVSFDEAQVGEQQLRETIAACGYEPRQATPAV